MNPGEVWSLEDGTRRVVLSNATYNSSNLRRVITAVVAGPPAGFDPFAVETPAGWIYADRLAMHPRHWLIGLVASIDDEARAAVSEHLKFLLGALA